MIPSQAVLFNYTRIFIARMCLVCPLCIVLDDPNRPNFKYPFIDHPCERKLFSYLILIKKFQCLSFSLVTKSFPI